MGPPLLRGPARILLAAFAAGPAACGGDAAEQAAPGAAGPIVLISLDTLRADHTSLYGYHLETTPTLEALARGATVYERAQASSPWTLPSHASMFTGLYPREHGARNYRPEELEPDGSPKPRPLGSRPVTLAEVLGAAGYRTGAVVANEAYLAPRFGVARGFDDYEVVSGTCDVVNERALDWIDSCGDRRFFLFLNYMDTHLPYNSGRRADGRRTPRSMRLMQALKPIVLAGRSGDGGAMLRALVKDYDDAVRRLDAGLGELFAALSRRGLWDGALVVVTSDHGEFLGEHDLVEHGKDVYQGVAHVPLLVKAPDQEVGEVDGQWISHVHLPGLILDRAGLAGLPAAAPLMRERSGERLVVTEHYAVMFGSLDEPWAPRLDRLRRAACRGGYKLIESEGRHELYDLERDPGERVDLAAARPDVVRDLAGRLQEWRRICAPRGPAEPVPLEVAADLEALRGLGYLGADEGDALDGSDAGGGD